jgi:hypothetical protein
MNGAVSLGCPSDWSPEVYAVVIAYLSEVAKRQTSEDDGPTIDMDSPEAEALLQ